MEEKKYIYLDKEYKLREKTFKPYRVMEKTLKNRYDDFIRRNVPNDLRISVVNSIAEQNPNVLKSVIDNPEAMIELILSMEQEKSSNFFEYSQAESRLKELFILEDENAKMLGELIFENGSEINHYPEDEQFEEYESFMLEALSIFFLKFKKQKMNV